MKSHASRIALLLAASGLEENEILDALKVIARIGPGEFMFRIRDIRRSMFRDLSSNYSSDLPAFLTKRSIGATTQRSAESSIRKQSIDSAIQMLVKESRLSPNIAAELLMKSFRRSGAATRSFPIFRTKDGLRKWLTRLPISGPDLVEHAIKIRNEASPASRQAWPLRDRDD
jgi:hypothetical protein